MSHGDDVRQRASLGMRPSRIGDTLPPDIRTALIGRHYSAGGPLDARASLDWYQAGPFAGCPLGDQHGTDAHGSRKSCSAAALAVDVGLKVHKPYLSAPLSVVKRAALRHDHSVALCNGAAMKPVEEVRRLRLLELKKKFRSWPALNAALDLDARDSTLSQYANRSKGTKSDKPKAMGSPMARKLEAVCKLPEGWMDTDPEYDGQRWPFGASITIEELQNLDHTALAEAAGMLKLLVAQSRRRRESSTQAEGKETPVALAESADFRREVLTPSGPLAPSMPRLPRALQSAHESDHPPSRKRSGRTPKQTASGGHEA